MSFRVRHAVHLAGLAAAALLTLDALGAPKSYKCDPGTAKVGVGCDCPEDMLPVVDAAGVARCGAPAKKSPPTSAGKPPPANCPVGMVGIPGGKYKLVEGAAEVEVSPFCLDKTEVTVRAYEACVDGKGCTAPTPYGSKGFDVFCNWKNPDGRAIHPVNCVEWDQATAYCSFVGARLPREEEWEWAARSGDKGWKYPWGDSAPNDERVNACGSECPRNAKAKAGIDRAKLYAGDDGFAETAPVGSFPKGDNRWGVHDLSGNVFEWLAIEEKAGPLVRHARGGGWLEYEAAGLSAGRDEPFDRYSPNPTVGFRCARMP